MANLIPAASRRLVQDRDGRCVRCHGRRGEWHHRRSRLTRDGHTHCPCNGVLLCPTCHRWVHRGDNAAARSAGLIASRHTLVPGFVPVATLGGWRMMLCSGLCLPLADDQVVADPLGRPLIAQALRSRFSAP